MTDLAQSAREQQQSLGNAAGVRRQEDHLSEDQPTSINRDGDIVGDEEDSPLFPSQQCASLETQWQTIQATFVDSPRTSVEEADALVTKTIETLAASFAEMRSSLERTWEKDGEVPTEELRLVLQNYRSFFRRLLSI
jgi:hypothetical protein